MSGGEGERRAEAKRWLAIAKEDMTAAQMCVSGHVPLATVAAYHCQQAVEKIAKAALVAAGRSFPKTHDLAALGALASSVYPELKEQMAALEPITVWGFAYRYPAEEEIARVPDVADIQRRLIDIGILRNAVLKRLGLD